MLTRKEEIDALNLYVKYKLQILSCENYCAAIEDYFLNSKPRRAALIATLKERLKHDNITATDKEIVAAMDNLVKGVKP
jgi:hypothetical protein